MRIVVFSGSFDPIHCGHAMMANYLAQYSWAEQVWLLPSPLNPLKCSAPPADFHHRLKMCRIVAEKCPGVEASDFEERLPLPSYTLLTLRALRDAYPEHDFRLVIGSDNWLCFDKWREPEALIREFGLIVYPRPGFDVEPDVPTRVQVLRDAPVAVISSTFVRHALAQGADLNYFLDTDVIDYIKKHHLYV